MSYRTSLQPQTATAASAGALVRRNHNARAYSGSAPTLAFDLTRIPIQAKPKVGGSQDSQEGEADRIADTVTRPGGSCTSCCDTCGDASRIRTRSIGAADEREAPDAVHETLGSPGRPLDAATRADLEPRFRRDFSGIRVHTDARAAASADAIGAQAYASGNHLVFGPGQFAPQSQAGRWLLAHELAHTVQQGHAAPVIQRKDKPKEADPLCETFDLKAATASADAAASGMKDLKEDDVGKRHKLVRALKPIIRCAPEADVTAMKSKLDTTLGEKTAAAVWKEAHTAFGGYTGMYPGYAGDMKSHLKNLGVKDTVPYDAYAVPDYDHDKPAKPADVQKGADKAAAALPNVEVLYFRGHQYAQYMAPGVFSEGDANHALDFRYLQKHGAFGNVKIMISTSCATLCQEAFNVFHGLFPNALLLGFRRSTPIDASGVRSSFEAKVNALKRPLLLDQKVDIGAIISAWRGVAEGKFAGSDSLPAYYDGGTLNFFDGKKWKTVSPTSPDNKCKHKGDETKVFPAPPAAGGGAAPAKAAGPPVS